MRYFLEIAYRGTHYAGWQVQPNAVTVQQKIEEALALVLRQETPVTAAGRTDAGVHALQMFAHFDVDNVLAGDIDWKHKLNSILPNDIAVKNIIRVSNEAHARFDAVLRTYIYIISGQKNPFKNGLYYRLNVPLNVERMNEAAKTLLQFTDFTSFSKLHTDTFTNTCNITFAEWKQHNDELIFTITADRFLRNMVRAIVGTLLWVGKEKITVDDFKKIIQAENRNLAGPSAPAEGLFLQKITYPESIFINE